MSATRHTVTNTYSAKVFKGTSALELLWVCKEWDLSQHMGTELACAPACSEMTGPLGLDLDLYLHLAQLATINLDLDLGDLATVNLDLDLGDLATVNLDLDLAPPLGHGRLGLLGLGFARLGLGRLELGFARLGLGPLELGFALHGRRVWLPSGPPVQLGLPLPPIVCWHSAAAILYPGGRPAQLPLFTQAVGLRHRLRAECAIMRTRLTHLGLRGLGFPTGW